MSVPLSYVRLMKERDGGRVAINGNLKYYGWQPAISEVICEDDKGSVIGIIYEIIPGYQNVIKPETREKIREILKKEKDRYGMGNKIAFRAFDYKMSKSKIEMAASLPIEKLIKITNLIEYLIDEDVRESRIR